MQLKKILLAGPWVGEFGWELFCWQGYIRSLSKNFDKTIVVSTKHSKFLYEDFCDQFIDFDATSGSYKDSFYKVGFSVSPEQWNSILEKISYDNKKEKLTIFKPRRIGNPPKTHFSDSFVFGPYKIIPEYLKLGKKDAQQNNNVVIHARNRDLRTQDNWPEENWNSLVNMLSSSGYNVFSIGLKNESLHIENSKDMRECQQDELLDLLASSICIFGPSSGAMHLASLCACPQVVWTTDYNFDRYTKNWNPFNTKVVFLSEYDWKPSPSYVFGKFKENFNENN